MPHRADFDKIEGLLIRVPHILITERSVARCATRLDRMWPAVGAPPRRLRERVRDAASIPSSHAMLRRRGECAA